MAVVGVARRELVEQAVEVGDRARLELDRRHGGGGADDEDGGDAGGGARSFATARRRAGDVVGVALPAGGDAEVVSVDHGC